MSGHCDKTVIAQKQPKKSSISAKTHSLGTSVNEKRHRNQSDSRHNLKASPESSHQYSPIYNALQDLPTDEGAPLKHRSYTSDNPMDPQGYSSDIHWNESDLVLSNPNFGSLSMPPAEHIRIQDYGSSDIWSGSSVPGCSHPYGNYPEHTAQLQQWAYETSNSNLTIAERFEKGNWEKRRRENL